MLNMFDILKSVLPEDNADQSNAYKITKECILESGIEDGVFLDLGCGDGKAVDWLRSNFKRLNYIGIDIENSTEASFRNRNDAEFMTYDGINLPFPDESISIVFSQQVFEHVLYPHLLLPEISRVLKKGGILVGSVSQLDLLWYLFYFKTK